MARTTNPYRVLGVAPSATDAELKAAYRALARRLHPDRNPGREGEVEPRFRELTAAYELLRDPRRRARYDASRAPRSTGARQAPPSPPSPEPPRRAPSSGPARNAPPPSPPDARVWAPREQSADAGPVVAGGAIAAILLMLVLLLAQHAG